MNRCTPTCLAASTIGSNGLRLTEVDSFSSSSKLASLEMQAQMDQGTVPFERVRQPGISGASGDKDGRKSLVHGSLLAMSGRLRQRPFGSPSAMTHKALEGAVGRLHACLSG
jgi:hypothetical protein